MNDRRFHLFVMGAGSLGSFLGGCIALGGKARVTLVGRDPHMNAVTKNGLTLEFQDRTETIAVQAVSDLTKIEIKPDLVVLTVQGYQTKSALNQLKSAFGDEITVITFQNGNLLDQIASLVGKENTIGGTTLINAKLLAPGHVRQNVQFPLVIGELCGKKTTRINQIQEIFEAGELEVHVSDNIIGEIWVKMIINSTGNTLTGATDQTLRQVFASPPIRKFAFQMVTESFMVAESAGVDLENIAPGPAKGFRSAIRSQETWDEFAEGDQPDIKLSMCALLEKGIKTEVDFTNGYIASKAVEIDQRAPHHEAIIAVINEIENGIRKPSPENLINLTV